MSSRVTVEVERPPGLPRVRRAPAVAGAALLALAVSMLVLAMDRRADMPTENIFHRNIQAIADAGVTQGYGAAAYCPDDLVTRGQMAAFLHRG